MQFSKTLLVLFFLLVFVLNTKCRTECFKTFETTVESASDGFGCTFDCWVHIRPSPDLALHLTVSTKNNEVRVFLSPYKIKVPILILKGLVPPHSIKNIIFAPKEGAMMLLNENKSECRPGSQTTFNFSRTEHRDEICDTFYHTVQREIAIIQHHRDTIVDQDCPYYIEAVHPNETIYLLSPTKFTVHWFGKRYEITHDHIHTIQNFSGAFLTMHSSSEGRLSEVLAVTTNETCTCPDEKVVLNFNEHFVLKSPGYNRFLCPNSRCITRFTAPAIADYMIPENHISRIFFSVTALPYHDVSLIVKSGNTSLVLDSSTYSNVYAKIIMDEKNLSIEYNTSYHLGTSYRGHFKIIAERVFIDRVFSENKYEDEFKIEVEVPSHCQMMSCYWRIMPLLDQTSEIEVELVNGDKFDEIHFLTKSGMIIYENHQLPLKIKQVNERTETHVIYWRTEESTNATLKISRKMKDEHEENEIPRILYRVSNLTFEDNSTAVLTTPTIPN